MHETQTIDLSADHSTNVTGQHRLLDRLAQLADVHDRVGGFADDHVLTTLVDRYRELEQLRRA